MRWVTTFALAIAVTTAHLFATDEAVVMRLSPQPNQVIHVSMEQEINTTLDGAALTVHGSTRAMLTETVGERQGTGQLASSIAYESLSMETTVNGQTVSASSLDLTDKAIAIVYDANGQLVDVTPPPNMDPAIAAFVKGMIGTLLGSRGGADVTLRLDETTTLPFAAAMNVPKTAGVPMNLTGETRLKLTGISRLDGHRVARLDQAIVAAMVTSPGVPGMPVTMTASGGGTVLWDLDRGYVRAGQTTIEIDAEIMQAKMHARISTIVRGSN